MAEEAKWYVVHTYSGYEQKVHDTIKKTAENRGITDIIVDVEVPTEVVVEDVPATDMSDEKKSKAEKKPKVKTTKLYPGYVMVKMIMTDESWYVVRNTRGVTGFVGPASKPVALSDEEVERMGIGRSGEVKLAPIKFKLGDEVTVKSGSMEGFTGKVISVDPEKRRVSVAVDMFGRETPAEFEASQVEKIEY